jgi:hypothetical protein
MKEPSVYEKVHWKLFNAFARLFGSLLVLACVAFAILTVKSLKVPGNSYPPWLLLVFLPLIALGVMLIKVKPYYPNEYEEWFEANKRLELNPEEKKKVLVSFAGFIVWGVTLFITFDIVTSLVKGSLSVKGLGGALAIVFVLQALRFVTVSRLR